MKRWLIFSALAAAAWFAMHRDAAVAMPLPDGSLAYPGYRFDALDGYEMEARVLSRHDYRDDREAALASTDLALGWGPMDDETVLARIQISQNHRWYFWHADSLPIPAAQITQHSANVHIIPASAQVASALAQVRSTDRVRLAGKLVEVHADDGWRWRSSLSRTDTGNGSCEVLWLERLDVL